MKKTLLMESVLGEARLAVIEDNRLCEIYTDRPGADDCAGSIYLGRVENVLPGMNAAFVDIGLEKNGFLYAGDVGLDMPHDGQLDRQVAGARIEKLVRPGAQVLVQVVKAQSGQKGHRVSCHVNLPGRLMVLLPDVQYIGVSRKIQEAPERDRLRGIAKAMLGDTGMGAILRTSARGAEAGAIEAEFDRLRGLWADISRRSEHTSAPRCVYSNADLSLRAVRDMLDADTDALWVDGEALYGEVRALAMEIAPRWADRVRCHAGDIPLFDLHRVDAQVEKALRKYVWLDSGGSLVIEQTEAMTVIDVNTGKFVGKRALSETIFKLNCEAAEEIIRQLRLRDIGGIVIVDFIDMEDTAQNEALLEKLCELARQDRNRLSVVGLTGLGLVELTRKRLRRPISRQLMHTCSDCGGDGVVPSHETTARRALREIWRRRRLGEGNPLVIEAAAPVTGLMKRVGAPEGGAVYARSCESMKAGEYRIAPVDEDRLPEGCARLKQPK